MDIETQPETHSLNEQDNNNMRQSVSNMSNISKIDMSAYTVQGPDWAKAIFAGPGPDPQGWATLSLALAPGQG